MLNRRFFMAAAAAFSGSSFLTACGGQSSATDSLAGDSPESASNAVSASFSAAAGTAASADGSTIPSGASLVDNAGAVWTLSGGAACKNKVAVSQPNVAMLLWQGGKIYQKNTSNQFYVWSNKWLICRDPRIALPAAAGFFYGINGHYDYLYTPAQIISILQDLGCSTYRVGCNGSSAQINAVVKLAKAFQAANLKLFALIQQGVTDASGAVFGSEAAAYSQAFSTAASVAAALKPYGVEMYECGNELTRRSQTVLYSNRAGTDAADFNNANWPAMRGVMRGLIDGVKSIQPTAKCGINFCVADIGASDALWDGNQPDGTTGHPKVRWDITTWHNYEVYGDLFNIGSDGAGPHFDLPTYCKARYGVPFMVTEWNANPEQSDAYRGAFAQQRLQSFYSARKKDNIQSVMYYVLDSGDHTFGAMINGTPIQPVYNALKNFASANQDA